MMNLEIEFERQMNEIKEASENALKLLLKIQYSEDFDKNKYLEEIEKNIESLSEISTNLLKMDFCFMYK